MLLEMLEMVLEMLEMMKLAEYLGRNVSFLLNAEPFKDWPVRRYVDNDSDPPEVRCSFKSCGLRFNYDPKDESVTCLFLEMEEHCGTVLSEVPFNMARAEVLAHFGTPSRSGGSLSDPILGDYGPWDRFENPNYTVHVQYKVDSDSIKMITLMRNDVVP